MIGSGVAVSFGNEFFNPHTPVAIPIHGFSDGKRLRVVFKTNHNAHRFVINFKTPGDITLHFNPRFDEQAVVRNSTHHGQWQQEERYGDSFPFHHDKIYTLEFVANHGQINVLLNGQHFTQYAERHGGHDVNLVEIDGDIHVHSAHVTH